MMNYLRYFSRKRNTNLEMPKTNFKMATTKGSININDDFNDWVKL